MPLQESTALADLLVIAGPRRVSWLRLARILPFLQCRTRSAGGIAGIFLTWPWRFAGAGGAGIARALSLLIHLKPPPWLQHVSCPLLRSDTSAWKKAWRPAHRAVGPYGFRLAVQPVPVIRLPATRPV